MSYKKPAVQPLMTSNTMQPKTKRVKMATTDDSTEKTTTKKSNATTTTQTVSETSQSRVKTKARQRTRNRLLNAARVVMGQKGIEATAINDITEQAELSFGSFYNYFSSKEEVARAVFVEDALALIGALDAATSPEAGIAERVGVNIRRTIQRGLNDPVWGWFWVHSTYSISDMTSTLGKPLGRDLLAGKKAGVFYIIDVESTVDCIIGGILFLLRKILEGGRPVTAVESMVHFILRGLGVPVEEVDRIIQIDISA